MNKGNMAGLGIMAAASVIVIAGTGPAYDAIQNQKIKAAAGGLETSVVTGEADGFGGPIQAEVTVAGDKIIALNLTGEGETPEIGGSAMSALTEAITAAQTLDGVDAVSGATITSNGVFGAIRNAMGIEAPAEETEAAAEEETEAVVLEGALTGEAKGFGGAVTAQVVLGDDGKIVELVLTGADETPGLGAAALDTLTEAILAEGSLEGVDAVSGATITSDAVFAAIEAAMAGDGAAAEETEAAEEADLEGALTGEAKGFGGAVTAQVVLGDDGKITELVLTGADETPGLGAAALDTLAEAILAEGSLEGVDAVSGATITSDAVFEAVEAAMAGEGEAEEEAEAAEAASGSVLTGEAKGFGGAVTAEVVLGDDGKIAELTLTGADETPGLGAAALDTLAEAILAEGSLEGVDAVSGATITSDAVFEAVEAALAQ